MIDAHNHLQDPRLDPWRDDILATCRQEGISRMVVNGTSEADWERVAALADRHPIVIPSFGLHPWFVPGRSADWRDQLERHLDARPFAVGEIGLDRWKKDLPYDDQEHVFITQLRIAAERDLPCSIHCLDAWGPLYDLLEAGPRPQRGFLLHSYGGSLDMMHRFAALGASFSFPGYYLRPDKTRQHEVFRNIPDDRLLIETDAPDQPLPRDKIRHPLPDPTLNHPANLPEVYTFVAALRGEEWETLQRTVDNNTRRLFG